MTTKQPAIRPDISRMPTDKEFSRALALLGVLKEKNTSSPEVAFAAYKIGLEGVCAYALKRGVRAALKDVKSKGGWCPTPPELHKYCMDFQGPIAAEENRARKRAEQLAEQKRVDDLHKQKTPESKARVNALAANFRAAMPPGGHIKSSLDQDLVAQIPDRPKREGATWSQLKAPPIAKPAPSSSSATASAPDGALTAEAKPGGAGWARLKTPSPTKKDAGEPDEDARGSDEEDA